MSLQQDLSDDRLDGNDFSGTERFEVVGQLGAGGMGTVYRAWDKEQQLEVALKRLHAMDADALMQLKLEFRRMRDIVHANLVTLGELVGEKEQWFFTMELVEGSDLLEALRPDWRYLPSSGSSRSSTDLGTASDELTPETVSIPDTVDTLVAAPATGGGSRDGALGIQLNVASGAAAPAADWELLRTLFIQLVQGVAALHQQGILHRDIKPPNIRVTPENRLVLLDFGIAEVRSRVVKARKAKRTDSTLSSITGTPLYMAPELYLGMDAGTASDWYSVGMVLFQALVGRPPLVGNSTDLLEYKSRFDLPSPRSWCPDVPEDLDALCVRLLSRDPAARPGAQEILCQLDRRQGAGALVLTANARSPDAAVFVGRASEIAVIQTAFARAASGAAVAVIVEGESGLGKTALTQHALDALVDATPQAVVLKGRSHERESVPFKAFDGIIDELSTLLAELSSEERAALIPENAELLTHLFPVLERVEGFPAPEAHARDTFEPAEFRRRSFGAVRDLLTRLASNKAVILFLDDLHWADADSLALLRELNRGSGAPAVLTVATVRPGASGAWAPPQGTVEELLGRDVTQLVLRPLEADHIQHLVHALAPDDARMAQQLESLSSASGGHPLYLQELMRHLQTHGTLPDSFPLDEALWMRAEALEREAKGLLHLVALAGRPLPNETLREASGLAPDQFAQSVRALSQGQLARSQGTRREDAIEPYHDRVRESVVVHLAPASKRDLHRKLAEALVEVGPPEPETISIHWYGAGESALSLQYAEQAARAADAAFAFERAVRLYRFCLKLCTDPDHQRRLRTQLGWSLVNAGSSTEAGQAFLEASQGATSAEALNLKRLAAEKLMQGGDLARGLPQMAETLAAAGLGFWEHPAKALLPLAWVRARVALRGLKYQQRGEDQLGADTLARMDVAETAANVYALLDPLCGSIYSSEFLLAALDAGEPLRLSRAFSSEYLFVNAGGTPGLERGKSLIEAAESLARDAGDARGLAFTLTQRGAVLYARDGRFASALDICAEAERILRTECHGVSYELATMAQFACGMLWYLGRWKEMKERALREHAAAVARGDQWAAANVCAAGVNSMFLMDDDPAGARGFLEESRRMLPKDHFYMATLLDFNARWNIDHYEGAGRKVHEECEATWKTIKRSFLMMVPMLGAISLETRARGALAAAVELQGAERKAAHRVAKGSGAALRKLKFSIGQPLADLVDATLAHQQGRDELAVVLLESAEQGFAKADAEMYKLFCACARGKVMGGDEGARVQAEAIAALSARGMRNPARVATVYAPGFGLTE